MQEKGKTNQKMTPDPPNQGPSNADTRGQQSRNVVSIKKLEKALAGLTQ